LRDELSADDERGSNPAIRSIPIKVTTIQSSKGLADDFVFICHFDDMYLVKDPEHVTDREICNFLVALTRAKKKVVLISSQVKEPTFLKWIATERVERM
jgi:superfamily I DNA/RNA helicase